MPELPPQRTLQQQFIDFRFNVIPPDAPEIQVTEMRRAFYAGAKAFKYLLEIGPDDYKALELYVFSLNEELDQFLIDIFMGRK